MFNLPLPPSPQQLYPHIPKWLATPFTKMPFSAQRAIITRALKEVFRDALMHGEWNFLKGRWLRVSITDLGVNWYFSYNGNQDILLSESGQNDVSISGRMQEFILLAARKEDPDTLFFQRRLLIEGDTELGLEVKNLIDSLDIETLPNELRFLIRSAGEYVELFCKQDNFQ